MRRVERYFRKKWNAETHLIWELRSNKNPKYPCSLFSIPKSSIFFWRHVSTHDFIPNTYLSFY